MGHVRKSCLLCMQCCSYARSPSCVSGGGGLVCDSTYAHLEQLQTQSAQGLGQHCTLAALNSPFGDQSYRVEVQAAMMILERIADMRSLLVILQCGIQLTTALLNSQERGACTQSAFAIMPGNLDKYVIGTRRRVL